MGASVVLGAFCGCVSMVMLMIFGALMSFSCCGPAFVCEPEAAYMTVPREPGMCDASREVKKCCDRNPWALGFGTTGGSLVLFTIYLIARGHKWNRTSLKRVDTSFKPMMHGGSRGQFGNSLFTVVPDLTVVRPPSALPPAGSLQTQQNAMQAPPAPYMYGPNGERPWSSYSGPVGAHVPARQHEPQRPKSFSDPPARRGPSFSTTPVPPPLPQRGSLMPQHRGSVTAPRGSLALPPSPSLAPPRSRGSMIA